MTLSAWLPLMSSESPLLLVLPATIVSAGRYQQGRPALRTLPRPPPPFEAELPLIVQDVRVMVVVAKIVDQSHRRPEGPNSR